MLEFTFVSQIILRTFTISVQSLKFTHKLHTSHLLKSVSEISKTWQTPKCNFLSNAPSQDPSCQWPTWGIITAAMDRTRLTVNHHVDEKYGKLALDSIKKLWRDRERKNYCFSISEGGERHRDFKAAGGWTLVVLNMKQQCTGQEDIEDMTLWMKTSRTVRNSNASS